MYSNRYLLSGGAAAIVLSMASQVQAEVRRFDIPAQPAVSAIPEFARQALLQVVAPARDLSGVNTPAIVGEMTVEKALDRLIAHTPLRIVSNANGIVTLASAQNTQRGQLAGRVLDPVTGQYLANASVRLTDANGQRRTGTSNYRGEFRFSGLAVGVANIELSFTGFEAQHASITIAANEASNVEFALVRQGENEAVAVGDVVVTASSRDGDARAIMSQRNSMDIKNSLSSESFGAIDEGNVGEFIRYMPGVDAEGEGDDSVRYVRLRGLPPEYTAITVNGVALSAADANNGAADSRAFSFEQVSLSSVDAIEISKTVSADVDANAPAGTINLRTKRAFDRKGRRISGSISGYTHSDMWNDNANGPGEGEHSKRFLPNGQIEYSDVFFDRRLGVVASLSQTNTYTELEQSYYPRSYEPTANSPEPMAMNSIFMRLNAQETSRFAGSLTLDYRATDRLILSLASIYNNSYLWSGQRTYSFTTGARANGVEGDPALDFITLRGASVAAGSNIIAKKGEGKTFVPSFEYAGDRFVIDGNLSYSDSTSTYDPQGEGAIYNFVTSPTATGNFHAYRPGLGSTQFKIQQVSGADWSDPASYAGTNSLTFNTQDGRYARVEQAGAALNLTAEVATPFAPVTFKTGLKLKRNVYDYENDRAAHQYRYVGPLSRAEFMTQYASDNRLNFNDMGIEYLTLSGADHLYMPSNYKIGELFKNSPELFQHTLTAANYYTANIANKRHFEEDSNAFYVMGTSELNDRLTVRAGVRWEQTETRARERDALTADEVRAAGYAVSASTGRATTIEGLQYQFESRPSVDRKGKYDYFFPSASAKYAINDSTDLQLGYSRTIRRAPISVLAGVWSVNDDMMTVTAPNPGLEPEISDNFSVRIAKYFEPVGLIAINYYRNEVDGLFQSEEMSAEEFGYTGSEYQDYRFITTRTVSGEAISIQGVELEFNHSMTYLPGLLDGISVRDSFTHNSPEIPIAGSSDNFGSLSVAYKKGPVRLNVNSAWNGEKFNSAASGSYIKARTVVNMSGSYDMGRGLTAYFTLRNLLDTPMHIMLPGQDTSAGYIGDHAGDYREYGRSGTAGIRFVF